MPNSREPLSSWLVTLTEAKVDSLVMHLLELTDTEFLRLCSCLQRRELFSLLLEASTGQKARMEIHRATQSKRTTLVRHCFLYPRSPICRFDRVKAMVVPVGEQ